MTAAVGAKKQLLVVEDNPGDVELLRLALKDAGVDCELILVKDGAVALDFIQRQGVSSRLPDLAIIDLNLPKHNGLEILQAISSNGVMAKMPVIVVSSSPYVADAENLVFLRTAHFIRKPLDLDDCLKIGVLVRELLASDRDTAGR